MSERSLEELHADPQHWKLGIFYFCREDRRALVPKRIRGLGWTLNFARPSAYVGIVLVAIFVAATLALARAAGASRDTLLLVKLALAFGILIFCHRVANAPAKLK